MVGQTIPYSRVMEEKGQGQRVARREYEVRLQMTRFGGSTSKYRRMEG